MATPWDQFIGAIEKRKKQLDELLDSYKEFKERLAALPPEIAQEAQKLLAADTSADVPEEEQDLAGKVALECAKIILQEMGNESMHFSAIAKLAIKRGYRGRSSGTPEEIENRITHSFWAAMHRSDAFEHVGDGRYRLTNY